MGELKSKLTGIKKYSHVQTNEHYVLQSGMKECWL